MSCLIYRTCEPSAATKKDACEALPGQPILVIHRRLMTDIRQRLVVSLRPVAKEDQIAVAEDRDRGVLRPHVHGQPIPAGSRRRCKHKIQNRKRGKVYEPGVEACIDTDSLVLAHDVTPRE